MAYKLGFIGTGNMGSALVLASLKNTDSTSVFVSDRSREKAQSLCEKCGVTLSTNEEIIKKCDFVFLGIKPQFIEAALSELQTVLSKNAKNTVLVSMAAGVSIEKINEYAGVKLPIVRIMPNTPAQIGEGMLLYCKNDLVSASAEKALLVAMGGAGIWNALDERLIDAGSALSGCGPAFVYMFIEALADGAVECGLSRDKALLYAAQTVKGAAGMVLKGEKHPGELKDDVCSPGGSTIEGVSALENGAFRANCINAVKAAFDKTKKLG